MKYLYDIYSHDCLTFGALNYFFRKKVHIFVKNTKKRKIFLENSKLIKSIRIFFLYGGHPPPLK